MLSTELRIVSQATVVPQSHDVETHADRTLPAAGENFSDRLYEVASFVCCHDHALQAPAFALFGRAQPTSSGPTNGNNMGKGVDFFFMLHGAPSLRREQQVTTSLAWRGAKGKKITAFAASWHGISGAGIPSRGKGSHTLSHDSVGAQNCCFEAARFTGFGATSTDSRSEIWTWAELVVAERAEAWGG